MHAGKLENVTLQEPDLNIEADPLETSENCLEVSDYDLRDITQDIHEGKNALLVAAELGADSSGEADSSDESEEQKQPQPQPQPQEQKKMLGKLSSVDSPRAALEKLTENLSGRALSEVNRSLTSSFKEVENSDDEGLFSSELSPVKKFNRLEEGFSEIKKKEDQVVQQIEQLQQQLEQLQQQLEQLQQQLEQKKAEVAQQLEKEKGQLALVTLLLEQKVAQEQQLQEQRTKVEVIQQQLQLELQKQKEIVAQLQQELEKQKAEAALQLEQQKEETAQQLQQKEAKVAQLQQQLEQQQTQVALQLDQQKREVAQLQQQLQQQKREVAQQPPQEMEQQKATQPQQLHLELQEQKAAVTGVFLGATVSMAAGHMGATAFVAGAATVGVMSSSLFIMMCTAGAAGIFLLLAYSISRMSNRCCFFSGSQKNTENLEQKPGSLRGALSARQQSV